MPNTNMIKKELRLFPVSENISLHESPVMAIRRKKDSGIVRGMKAVKEGEAEAFLSAGSTGAILAGAQLIVGREKGSPPSSSCCFNAYKTGSNFTYRLAGPMWMPIRSG